MLEFLEQRLFTLLLQVLRLVRVGHIPAVLRAGDKARVGLLQPPQIVVVGGEVAVNLAGHFARALEAQEVGFQQRGEFRAGFMLLPARAQLFDELGVNVLVGGRPRLQVVRRPVDSTAFIADEQLHLRRLRHLRALLVIFGHLLGQEDHAVAFGKAAAQAGKEFVGGQRHRRVVAHEPGHHAVENAARVAFDDELQLAVFYLGDRQLPQMRLHEIPGRLHRAATSLEALFQPAVGLVG